MGKYKVYTVNPFDVRNSSKDLLEFGNYGFHYWFKEISKLEVWIDETLSEHERLYFLENIKTQLKILDSGGSEHEAYIEGEKKEKAERKKISQLHFQGKVKTIPPGELYVKKLGNVGENGSEAVVSIVDGEMVRNLYKTDFVEGGNWQVYKFIPKNEIWIEKDVQKPEVKFILLHEFVEAGLMGQGESYAKAHKEANKQEMKARKKATYGGLIPSGN